jgi:superfamily I DNA/RNA helicase
MSDEELERDRQRFLDALLASGSHGKVIVAGPGTGKTYSFKKLLEVSPEPRLVLTFINNLIADLDRELGKVAEVKTFHRFCRGLLHHLAPGGITHDVDYYPPLTRILAADVGVLLQRNVTQSDLEAVLHTLAETDEILAAAIRCGDYYNAVGHTDAVFRMVRHFDDRPEDMPAYGQIVVDEYQDFSPLEVRLIGQLSTVSPTLVVGDDDQALYGFKHASADFLRELATGGLYERFELPYCSRCTDVLVAATNHVVTVARAQGLLEGRLDKRFDSYSPTKRPDSERYPKIVHARCTVQTRKAPLMARYIEQQIRAIPTAEVETSEQGHYPTVLVVGPVQFASRIYTHLAERFRNVEYKRSEQSELSLLDGYRRLLDDPDSRLGWRIVAQVDQVDGLPTIIAQAIDEGRELSVLLSEEYRRRHSELIELLRKLRDVEPLDEQEVLQLEAAVEMSLLDVQQRLDLAIEAGEDEDDEAVEELAATERPARDELPEPRIVVTSLVGAKGLQACHVFVVGVNERHFPWDNSSPTDDEVCQLIVALTRATKSCHVVSTGRFGAQQVAESVFVQWLHDFIERVEVNAQYFRAQGGALA